MLPVLTFHAIDDEPAVISFPPATLARAAAGLEKAGYRTVTLAEASDCVRSHTPLPERSCVITFDDGYESVFRSAFPILRRHNMRATVFLTAGDTPPEEEDRRFPSLSGRTMLNWREVKEMAAAGWEMGAHTVTHPDLTRLSAPQVEREMQGSQQRLLQALGIESAPFAYPFGRHDQTARELAARYFSCACTDEFKFLTEFSGLYAMPRLDSYYLRRPAWFERLESPAFHTYVRMRGWMRRFRRVQLAGLGLGWRTRQRTPS